VLTEYRTMLGGIFKHVYSLDNTRIARVFPNAQPIELGLLQRGECLIARQGCSAVAEAAVAEKLVPRQRANNPSTPPMAASVTA
jgi:hypothetical protein